MHFSLATLAVVAALASCDHQGQAGTLPMSRQDDPSSSITVPTEASSAVDQAKADAAARTGIEASAWKVTRLEAAQWPDASLGCPKPGEMYAQVLMPGFLIELSAEGRTLEYHSGGKRTVYCR